MDYEGLGSGWPADHGRLFGLIADGIGQIMVLRSLILALGCMFACRVMVAEELPDIASVPMDLESPQMQDVAPAAGKRVKVVLESYRSTEVYHSLYLPSDWQSGLSYPVIVEYAGNGPFRNKYGDVCTGKVEDCNLGYGISAGKGYIWICLPYVSDDHQQNQQQWWGDVEATVAYCKATVPLVCQEYGGDPQLVFLAGFSRGSIACNFIGLHNDEIAALWRGFICHSHYDGVKDWGYPRAVGEAALRRLQRLGNRPQFISHEGSTEETKKYLSQTNFEGDFTFQILPFRNHTDTWVLRDTPTRQKLRKWIAKQMKKEKQ